MVVVYRVVVEYGGCGETPFIRLFRGDKLIYTYYYPEDVEDLTDSLKALEVPSHIIEDFIKIVEAVSILWRNSLLKTFTLNIVD